jgi:thioredoxin 1
MSSGDLASFTSTTSHGRMVSRAELRSKTRGVAYAPVEETLATKSVAISDRTFDSEVLKSETPVLVDFWAEWCPPCKMIAPILEEIATEKSGQIKIAKLDTDQNPRVPQKLGVMSLPTLILFKNGAEISRVVGFRSKKQLVQQLELAI